MDRRLALCARLPDERRPLTLLGGASWRLRGPPPDRPVSQKGVEWTEGALVVRTHASVLLCSNLPIAP
eukprot:6178418-Pleurochrysis_carterae.AAC.2